MKLIFTLVIVVMIIPVSFAQFGDDQPKRNELCFQKSLDRLGQRYADWECGNNDQILDCNERLDVDPNTQLVFLTSSGRPFTGSCETCHENGLKERFVTFNAGKTHGIDTTYYQSGCPQVIRNHIEGVENGRWRYYNDSSGLLAWEMNYINGQKHGKSIFFNHYQVDSDIVKLKIGNQEVKYPYGIYDSDTIRLEFYKDGKLDGKRTEYYPGSKPKKEVHYKDGVFHGPFIVYDTKGNVLQELNYEEGKKDGNWKYYYEDGSLLRTENWSEDVKVGEHKVFYIQGHIQTKETYDNKGRKHGWFEERFADDKIKRRALYEKDELIEEHVFDQFGREIKTVGEVTSGKEDDALPNAERKKKWWQFWK